MGRAPRITGKARVGKRLRAVAPVLTPAAAVLRYQWLRDDRPIPRATGTSYRVAKKDRGHRLRVRVTGTRAGFRTKVVLSAAVRVRR
ncbi:hypothetical protein D9M70_651460 [compost metagenome]